MPITAIGWEHAGDIVVTKDVEWEGGWGWSQGPIKGFQERNHFIARRDVL